MRRNCIKAPCLTFPPGWFDGLLAESLGRPFMCFSGVGTDAGGCRCLSPASAVVVSIWLFAMELRGK